MTEKGLTRSLAIACAICIITLSVLIGLFIHNSSKPIRFELAIRELEEGIYCYKTDVVSAIPAQNYTLIVICDDDGNTYTIHGDLKTCDYNGKPYVIWDHKEVINSDSVTIYAPIDTIKYCGVTSVR